MIKDFTCCKCKKITPFELVFDKDGNCVGTKEELVCSCGYQNFTTKLEVSIDSASRWVGSYGVNG